MSVGVKKKKKKKKKKPSIIVFCIYSLLRLYWVREDDLFGEQKIK